MSEGGEGGQGAPAGGADGSSAGQPSLADHSYTPNEGISTSNDTNKRTKYTEIEKTKKPDIQVERVVQRQREGDPYSHQR